MTNTPLTQTLGRIKSEVDSLIASVVMLQAEPDANAEAQEKLRAQLTELIEIRRACDRLADVCEWVLSVFKSRDLPNTRDLRTLRCFMTAWNKAHDALRENTSSEVPAEVAHD